MSLTATDLRIIDRARAFSEAFTTDALRAVTGTPAKEDGAAVRIEALGTGQFLIGELIAIISRLDDEDDHWRDYDYTCSVCGARIGIFTGREGWHHYRGEGTAASPVELYDAGHEAVLAQVTETSGG